MKDKIARIIDPLAFSFQDSGVAAIYENDRAKALHLAGKILDAIAATAKPTAPTPAPLVPDHWTSNSDDSILWWTGAGGPIFQAVTLGDGTFGLVSVRWAPDSAALSEEIRNAERFANAGRPARPVFIQRAAGILNDRGVTPARAAPTINEPMVPATAEPDAAARWCYDPVKGTVWHISDPLNVVEALPRFYGDGYFLAKGQKHFDEPVRVEMFQASEEAWAAMSASDHIGVFAKLVAGILNDRGVKP